MIDAYKIGKRMDQIGLTQEGLAEKIGVSRKTVNSYLASGEVKKPKLIGPIAKALGVEASWLLATNTATDSFNVSDTTMGNGNATGNNNMVQEQRSDYNNSLESKIEDLLLRLEAKDEIIRTKDEVIKLLRQKGDRDN